MPYVATTLGGNTSGTLLPPRRTQVKTEGSRRWSAVATNETCDTSPERPASSTASASNPGRTTTGVPVTIERVTTASPPMCASGRQAIHACRAGSTPSRAEVASAEAAMASWVSTTPLGRPDGARRRDDQCVAVLDPDAVRQRTLLTIGAHNARRAQGVEQHLARRRGQPGVEGSRGIARVPNRLQSIDEADATGKVECDELRHRPVA